MNPPRTVARHHLPAASFATLSSGEGSAEITHSFWASEESRRLLLVSTLLDELRLNPAALGPLSPVGDVVAVLAEAQRAAPDAVRGLLLDPGVGSGCAYALRRLHGGAKSDAPLWLDLGVVHALGLAAAARAGLSWSTSLPLRDGNVMLHTYGMARFPATTAPTVEARTENGRVSFRCDGCELPMPADGSDVEPDGERGGWWALRQVRIGGDLPLSVRLDDLDPLRDLADPVPPARLDQESFGRWVRLIDDGWALLCRDYRPDAEAMVDGVTAIVPLKHLPGWDTRSASNGEAFGSVMLSEPPDPVTMAVSLIHEYQHIKLGALLHLVGLTKPDDGSLYYAPWRDDPRPLAGLIQGIYAFFGIAKFWRVRRDKVDGDERALAAFEYVYARLQTAESLEIALSAPGLTDEGRRLFEGLKERVDEWSGEPGEVDGWIERLAQITADSHRIGWRLRHFHPQGEEVAALAGRLAQHQAPPRSPLVPAAIRPHRELRWRQRIPAAARRQVRDGLDAAVPAARDPLATGENALLVQEARAAREAFVGALDRYAVPDAGQGDVPDDEARAWAGLAMSLAAEGQTAAATVLSRRPDLVRAVYAESAARLSATPVDVADWLAPALVGAEPREPR